MIMEILSSEDEFITTSFIDDGLRKLILIESTEQAED